ncbi:Predicted flavoprotein CzcO associated with the cation diffusion facilitator CzcD [Paraburkholderia fungorum]|uniref:Predicted flavoprotein CzcO associated with the cation diffusion facilitator CzcD n=1 Tax=Paraburkholderia fungorum TaxID=134537 RepID=A0A1H1JEW7_9BURK|nr:NAD(P)-binding domain-containing protein [Paraburkholderia fungorum]SDR48481.1 Predicted flavoprotein CzcO associated with the cation diffusion facilitator CzcD [Paraburkholderia fungorum]
MTQTVHPDDEARRTLELLGPAPENWVPDRPGIDHNVLIVGGGQSGCAFAFALRRAGIGRVSVIDAADDASQAGVWLTRARMNRLRTPKSLVGPEGGLPGLGFQAWYEARFGAAAYREIERAPREQWADYLAWYREFLQIPIRYGTRLLKIEPLGTHFRLHLDVNGVARVESARKVLLCNGVAGNGGAFVPHVLQQLPPSLVAHTSHAIDFDALRGKSVAVLGGAASAFDAAATALEAGAAEVHLFARRATLAAVPVSRSRGYPGAYDNYFDLPDALRWFQALRFRRSGSTAPLDAIQRATRFANFHLHPGTEWEAASESSGRMTAQVSGETFQFDFAIAGTGYFIDPSARPELAAFASQIRLWRDQYTPPASDADDALGAHPYLGAALEYLEKSTGQAPFLKDIHVYNPAGFVSAGVPVGDVPSMKRDIPAVVRRISRDLFLADLDSHAVRLSADIPADFDDSAYASSIWQREASNV